MKTPFISFSTIIYHLIISFSAKYAEQPRSALIYKRNGTNTDNNSNHHKFNPFLIYLFAFILIVCLFSLVNENDNDDDVKVKPPTFTPFYTRRHNVVFDDDDKTSY